MRSTWWTRGGRVGVALALLALAAGVPAASAKPAPGKPVKRSGSHLFALTFGVMNVNNQYCGINNIGEVCVDPTNSPVVGGGFWPKGSPDQYIFNSGLQLGGTIPQNAGFAWAGDTVGAFFMDPRGDQGEGDPVTLVYNSLDPGDQTGANWPTGAYVRDTNLYHPVLVAAADSGLSKRDGSGISISQEDLWVRTWEGNPAFLAGRTHPMGILVEERGVAWNYPTGDEDIIYFIYTFYNVTASNPAKYANLDPEHRTDVANLGAEFQQLNEAKFGVSIPDDGYQITNMYAAFFADMDVGNASFNYSTPVVPFAMGVAYKSDFLEPNWLFPADLFGAPFAPSPGFIGVKYLRSPTDSTGKQIGLTIWSNTLNSGTGYPDPIGVKQMYRYISGTSSPASGDFPCTFQGQQLLLHFCYAAQTAADTRFFQSSGPLTLNPGEAKSIVVAYINSAPVATPALLTAIGGDFPPGIPASGDSIAANPARVRPIERVMGWVSQADTNADQKIEQYEVNTVPRSLLNKALVAQAVYDNRFLLPFAPTPPTFFLVPGDNQVTIAWQKSSTEGASGGDPFYAIASDPTSKLYDPNFRQFDVEGYRIYRGRTTGNLQLVAQFDYSGTQIIDYTGSFAYTSDLNGDGISQCAPELGLQADCPVQFPSVTGQPHDLVGDVIQVPLGGRTTLLGKDSIVTDSLGNKDTLAVAGSILILKADTAVTGGGKFPKLRDTGVNFAFVDRGVLNSFTYYYAVTAFDVNSLLSGPSSLESAKVTKQTTPRAAGSNTETVTLVRGVYGGDGTLLDPTASYPSIDAAKGTFSGNMPPANTAALILGSAVTEALPQGDIAVTIDSVSWGVGAALGPFPNPSAYLTLSAAGNVVHKVVDIPQPDITATGNTGYAFDQALVPYDSANAARFGMSPAFIANAKMPVTFGDSVIPILRTSIGLTTSIGRFGNGNAATQYLAHSRWFAPGAGEPPDPTIVGAPDSAHNSGALPGVSKIWAPAAYRDDNVNVRFRNYSYAQTNWYPADFLVTWNADSSVTVFDSTHHSVLPFKASAGTGWGFMNVRAFTAAGITATQLHQTDAIPTDINNVTYNHIYGINGTCTSRGLPSCIQLERTAQYEALDLNHDGAADANGIALDINGEVFLMSMTAIPAAGTKWRLRAVTGTMTANCTPAIQAIMTDCSGYTFSGSGVRSAMAPGLTYKITVSQKYTVADNTSGDLSRVHTVPDPYYVSSSLEATANTKLLKFIHLPSRAIIRIYSVSGILVNVITHNDPGGAGEATWNLRNRNNQFVASGVYFYHVEGPDGKTKVGRFTVVNYAP